MILRTMRPTSQQTHQILILQLNNIMRNDRLIPGMILVLVGLVILLDNLGYISFYWVDIWHLWPLFLIVAGVNPVFSTQPSAPYKVVKIVIGIGSFLIVIVPFGGFGPGFGHPHPPS